MARRDDNLYHNLITIVIFLAFLIVTGVLGYRLLEGWSWLDALYMTFISFSTVGFNEIGPLGTFGRVFTMFIIFMGMVLIAMLSASVTSWFVKNELLLKRKLLKMQRQISKLRDHIIICGAGDTGNTLIKEFLHSKKPFVIIENKQDVLDDLRDHYPGILIINGDATSDETLIAANIAHAGGLITALPVDADNLFVVVSARALNTNLLIISRAIVPTTEKKLYNAGASYVISPGVVEGLRMASVILRPTVVSFLEVMMRSNELSLRIEEIDVPAGSNLHEKSLLEARIPQRTGLIVIAMKRGADSSWIFNPSSKTVLQENDKLIVLGDPDQVDKLSTLLKM